MIYVLILMLLHRDTGPRGSRANLSLPLSTQRPLMQPCRNMLNLLSTRPFRTDSYFRVLGTVGPPLIE